MANYFEMAANNPTMIAETVNAMRDAVSEVGVPFSGDAREYMKLASEHPELKEALRSRLAQLAANADAEFKVEAGLPAAEAVEKLTAIEKSMHGDPTQVPLGPPVALLLIAATLLFLPSILGVAGYTLFGTSGGRPSGPGSPPSEGE